MFLYTVAYFVALISLAGVIGLLSLAIYRDVQAEKASKYEYPAVKDAKSVEE